MVGIGRRDLGESGGNCLKYLKREWNRKEGRGHKDFKKGGKLGQEVGALKGVLETPYKLCGSFSLKSYTMGRDLYKQIKLAKNIRI